MLPKKARTHFSSKIDLENFHFNDCSLKNQYTSDSAVNESKMSSDSSYSKPFRDALFVKKTVEVKSLKRSQAVIKDYKILLWICFIWGLPYFPSHLQRSSTDDSIFLICMALLFNILKTLVSIITICYTGYVMPNTSLVITFNSFIVFSLAVNWCIFLKRLDIISNIKMIVAVTHQVSPRKFKSQFNIYLFVVLNLVIVCIVAFSTTVVSLESYKYTNMTSPFFLWYAVTKEYEGIFRTSLGVCTAVTFINCVAVSCIAAMLATTVYFHLGDIIENFGEKLLKRFQQQPVNQHSLSENLCMFKRVSSLNQAVNRAFSTLMLFVYAAVMSIFFTSVCMSKIFETVYSFPEFGVLILALFSFALFCFFSLTRAGERILKKDEELKEKVTSCTQVIIDSGIFEKGIMWFSLMSTEIRSACLQVEGGNMFVICNHLVLTVTGTLITYGIIIFQMD